MTDPFSYDPLPLKIVGTARVRYRMTPTLSPEEIDTYTCRKCRNLNCTCAPSMPTPAFYSPAMDRPMELEPSTPEPVQPSMQPGAQATRAANKHFDTDGMIAHQARVIDALLELLGTGGVSLETFRTDLRPLANIERKGNTYEIRRGTKTPMGS